MKYVQTIEFTTTRIDEVMALDAKWESSTVGKRTATGMRITKDRDRPNTYMWVIEFPSAEGAAKNNDLPETAEIAEKMAKLCDGEPIFRNLDLLEERDL